MLNITSNLCIERLTRFLLNSNQIKNSYNEYAINFNNIYPSSYQYEFDEKYKDIAYKEYKEQLTYSNNIGNSCSSQHRIERKRSKLQVSSFSSLGLTIYLAVTSAAINESDKEEITEVDKLTKINLESELKNSDLKITKLEIDFNNLIYGLLSAPRANETGKFVGNSKIVVGNSIEFNKCNTLHTSFVARGVSSRLGHKKEVFGNFYEPIMGENHAYI